MKFEIEIDDTKVQKLSDQAKAKLKEHCKQWTDDIIDETTRVEAANNNPEITAAAISKTVSYKKRITQNPKKKIGQKIIQLIAFISSMVAGSLLDPEKFKDTNHVIWFIVALSVSIGTTVYLTFNSEQNG